MRGRIDMPSLVGGVVVVGLGMLLLLDTLGTLALTPGWLCAMLAGASGAILLAGGLARRDR